MNPNKPVLSHWAWRLAFALAFVALAGALAYAVYLLSLTSGGG